MLLLQFFYLKSQNFSSVRGSFPDRNEQCWEDEQKVEGSNPSRGPSGWESRSQGTAFGNENEPKFKDPGFEPRPRQTIVV